MRTKDGRSTPAGTKVLALALALLLALAVLGISPGAARAEEPVEPDTVASEPPPETSTLPEPAETDDSALPASETTSEAALPPESAETDDGALTVTTVNGLPCVAGEVLVQFRRSTSDANVQATLESVDAGAPEEIKDNLHVAEVPEGETISGYIETLEDQPDVLFAQPNYVYYLADTNIVPAGDLQEGRGLTGLTNDSYLSYQWHLAKIGAYTAWDTTMGDSGVRVAVLDTGADLDHPDLAGRIVAQTDVVDNDGSADDDMGHGTHVAGTIAATANNGIGVAGVAPGASLIIVDVFHRDDKGTPSIADDEWLATTTDISEGITYAINNGADVINLSLGGYSNDTVEENAIAAAANAGVVVVAAAGNNSTSATIYPGDLDSVICVTATGPSDEFASYSNYGPAKDIAAPGGTGEYAESVQPLDWILATGMGGGYGWMIGTSSAAPVVSGVVALMLSMNYNMTVDEVKDYLYNSAVDLGAAGKDDYYGYGRVSASAAIAAVPYIKSASYGINRRKGVVYSIPIGTPVSLLISDLTANNGIVKIYNSSSQEVTSGNLATSMSVRLINGSITEDELTLAVKGDVSGDGSLSIADYTLLRLYLLNKISLSTAASVAGEVSGDGALGISDYTDIRLALLNLKPLS